MDRRGAVRFLNVGFNPPDRVKMATANYRSEQDTASRFLTDVVKFEPEAQVMTSRLTAAHSAWCKDAGIGQRSEEGHWKRVAAELSKRGATPGRTNKGRLWRGLDLRQRESEGTPETDEHDGCDRSAEYPARRPESWDNRKSCHTRHGGAQDGEIERVLGLVRSHFPGSTEADATCA